MNRPEIYKKTVDILYNAYFNDTLMHSSCYACAVGNIVASNMGYEIYPSGKYLRWRISKKLFTPLWDEVFSTAYGKQLINMQAYHDNPFAKGQIDSTGYKIGELAEIEFAFENASRGNSEEDFMFNGLVAVLNVLKDIHKVEDNKECIERFTQLKLNRMLI